MTLFAAHDIPFTLVGAGALFLGICAFSVLFNFSVFWLMPVGVRVAGWPVRGLLLLSLASAVLTTLFWAVIRGAKWWVTGSLE